MTMWSEQPAKPRYERRIGKRVQPGGTMVLQWRPEHRTGVATRLRNDAVAERVRVIDVSVSGAQLLVPADERIQRGSVVEIGAGHSWGVADVRWVAPVPGKRYAQCGVQFWELDGHLRDLLYRQTVEPDHLERYERWARAR